MHCGLCTCQDLMMSWSDRAFLASAFADSIQSIQHRLQQGRRDSLHQSKVLHMKVTRMGNYVINSVARDKLSYA